MQFYLVCDHVIFLMKHFASECFNSCHFVFQHLLNTNTTAINSISRFLKFSLWRILNFHI